MKTTLRSLLSISLLILIFVSKSNGQAFKEITVVGGYTLGETFATTDGPFFFLSAGQKYDLKNRKIIPGGQRPATDDDDK